MSEEIKVCSVAKLPPGKVVGAGPYAVGNADGELFAVTRRCRHLMADLADGSIASDGCLVCPWHHAKYDVETGRMVRGPQGIFAKIPFLGTTYKILTTVLPLRRGKVTKRKTIIYVE
ncbi:MAG: Rieske 2Fe-2S domain-containing protein [Acidimicrobiia bacterium]|nr:Rieske 2Fe-2S domain-containing protein [Acidimicrobiia bacterium]